jgi:iron complex transport system ATP-binding protein
MDGIVASSSARNDVQHGVTDHGGKAEFSPPVLLAEEVTLAYEGNVVVHGVSVAIPPGKVTVIIGPNGCGKSTLLKALARVLKPLSGTVLLDGKSIHRSDTREVARKVGLLPQTATAPEGLTVEDLVARGRYAHQSWFNQWTPDDEAAVERALAQTQLTELRHRAVDDLSGGQRQRAWIAVTLAQNPPLMLLDEPTTYLDISHRLEVLDLLADLNDHDRRTVVMVLHDIGEACRYADHVIGMRNGKILMHGPAVEVVTKESMLALFDLGCEVVSDPQTGTPLVVPFDRRRRTRMIDR